MFTRKLFKDDKSIMVSSMAQRTDSILSSTDYDGAKKSQDYNCPKTFIRNPIVMVLTKKHYIPNPHNLRSIQ